MTKTKTAKKQKTTRWLEINTLDDGVRPWDKVDRTPKAETTYLPPGGAGSTGTDVRLLVRPGTQESVVIEMLNAIRFGIDHGALRSIEQPGDELTRERKALKQTARLFPVGKLPVAIDTFTRDAMAGDNADVVRAAREALTRFGNLVSLPGTEFDDKIPF